MKNEILKYQFDEQLIEFEIINGNVMVNATHMAKIFNKQVVAFTRNSETIAFKHQCLKSENSHFISLNNEHDLIISKQKSGTFMHRILALKFAAWLNPRFELWVYSTIDKILFDYYKKLEESLKLSAQRKDRMDELRVLMTNNEDFQEYDKLEREEKRAAALRGKENRSQLEMFREAN